MPKPPPPQLPPPTIDGTLRWLRIWYSVLLIAMALYVAVSERAQHQLIDMNRAFLSGLGVIAAVLVGIAFYVQVKVIRPALETLQAKPGAADAISSWRSASLASYVIAEAIVLFGLCLRFLGGARIMSIPFYFVGIALMLFLFPRRP
ncbi:MAG TPA: hypothetical protein VMD78_08910 [Candidatus Baltobacteraceae bacterium]|nr:hypothetical protein [Candidatus Baltobacteraceae bacterium]